MGARRNLTDKKLKKQALAARLPVWLSQRLFGAVLLVLVLGVPAGIGLWMLSQPDTLPIRSVNVEGEFRHLAQKDVYDALGGLASGGFFNVDVRAVKLAAESLPWVDSASVRRAWPSTLRVEITEQVPLAKWGKDQAVNVRGELFRLSEKELPEKLPDFMGPDGTEKKVAVNYRLLSEKLAKIDMRINEVILTDRRAWRIQLENGLNLLFGKTINEDLLERFIAAYPYLLAKRSGQPESIDLRYANGFAVRWKDTSTS
jgi:cell division protein FtsQ